MKKLLLSATIFFTAWQLLAGCKNNTDTAAGMAGAEKKPISDTPEYFNLRPALEKMYGYTHAVKIGNHIKISGAVSMTDSGTLVGEGNMELQMKNCYSDLEKILKHYGYTYDEVIAENIYTTNMQEFIRVAGFRNSIYKKQFPAGTWLEVKGLALPGQLIEIDMEAHKTH